MYKLDTKKKRRKRSALVAIRVEASRITAANEELVAKYAGAVVKLAL